MKNKPLYTQGDNEVWDAKEYLRPVVITSSQYFWLVIGAVAVSALVCAGILLVVKYIYGYTSW